MDFDKKKNYALIYMYMIHVGLKFILFASNTT